ncbi:GIY-YIG nuclease family protein [Blastomonas sp.]|uniref:GIY-YIG nuclease family protein n=1 Tax=Blastomonas sp. TaxID=1909299 RepID=UPI00391D7E22
MSDLDLDDLRNELEEFAQPAKKVTRSPREERIIAGFEDIQRFVEQHGRAPQHGEDRDIFERLYAVRLDRLRAQDDCRELLAPLDHQGLLAGEGMSAPELVEAMDENELLAELEGIAGDDNITRLRHVRPSAEKRAAEEIANREPCPDFDEFKPTFERVKRELKEGARETRRIENTENSLADIKPGALFIVGGQVALVADEDQAFVTEYKRTDRRLRVIYDNKTQSNVLARSFQKALYRDDAARRITELSAGPLFAGENDDDDQASGTIYVLRSKSDHPLVAANRGVLHKIGVTGGDVARRIANARLDPTFLMADVEIVATYTLFNINRTKLENLIHRIFDPARLDIEIKDRFGNPVVPREWFLVPRFVVDDAVERIKDGTITKYEYDPKVAQLVMREDMTDV